MPFILDKKNQSKCGNATVWIVIIIISVIFSIFITIPSVKKWTDLRTNIENLKEANLNYESDISSKESQLSSIKEKFNSVAESFLKEEKSLFPESIDTNKIAKMLELYSIQYSLIDSNSLFELNSISFSEQASENYTKTSINMSISSTQESLMDFIYFVQNNELPEKFKKSQNSSTSLLSTYITENNFIKDNLLPIANIESIVSSKNDQDNRLLETDIQINLFSQKKATNEKQ